MDARAKTSSVAVCCVNFWRGFTLDDGFIAYLLAQAFGRFHAVADEADADLVLTSVFPHAAPQYPEKSVALIWENARPDYRLYRYSISSDFDSYGGRNCRMPNWYRELDWDAQYRPRSSRQNNRGYEPPVSIDMLMTPRVHMDPAREKFCCFVSKYREPHRALAVEALSRIAPLDLFGGVVDSPLRRSKYAVLADYRFNLCFENSIFPGYYTEKIIHAWAGGCIPLYWSDPWYSREFNAEAILNRIDFPSLEEFVVHVAEVNASPARMDAVRREPLLRERPTLNAPIAFLRRTLAEFSL